MEKELELQEIRGFIRRRKRTFIFSCLTIFFIGLIIALILPSIYTSEAMIRIEEQQIPENIVQSTVTDYADERIEKLSREILSRSRLLDIIDKFNLYPELKGKKSRGDLVRLMSENIELETISASMQNERNGKQMTATVAFTLSYGGKDPAKVYKVTETLANLFLEEDTKQRTKFIKGTTDFLKNELHRLKSEIDRQEKIISDFKQNHVRELPVDREYNLQAIARLEREMETADMQLQLLQEQKMLLDARLASVDPLNPIMIDGEDLAMNPADRLKQLRLELLRMQSIYSEKHPNIRKKKREIQKLEQEVQESDGSVEQIKRLRQLEAELASAKTKLGPKHPDVIALKKEIDLLDSQIENMTAKSARTTISETNPDNPVYIALKTQIETLDMKIRGYLQERPRRLADLEEYRQRVQNTPMVEQEFNALTRDYDSLKQKYSEISNKLMSAELAEEMEGKEKGARFNITSPAYLPAKPSKPNRWMIIAVSFVLAIGLSSGLAAFQEYMDNSIKSADQLKRLTNIPVFSNISYIETEREKRQRRVKYAVSAAAALVCIGLILLLVNTFVIGLDQAWKVVMDRLLMIA